MVSSPDTTDHESDAFEDAEDSRTPMKPTVPMPSTATRSLTDRRQSSGSATTTTPRATEHPPLPPISPPVPDSEIDDIGEPVPSPPPEEEETPRKQNKSPLLTAHRLSTSSLDEVNLAGPKEEESAESKDQSNGTSPAVPPKDSHSPKNFSLGNISSSLPSVPWGQPPANKNLPQHSQAPPPPRKLTSPFSWLSRSSTTPKELKSPPLSMNGGDRRNTAASVSTVGSNPELLLGKLQDGQDVDSASLDSRRTTRSSLKDQFKLLRMREEAGVTMEDHESVVSANGAPTGSSSVGSPDSIAEEGEEGQTATSPVVTPPAATSPSGIPATVNLNLAPGTVSGISASASDASAPVDWEVWQQIVNHGPQALNGSNSDELNAAIKRGIPQTLRGVIWQVLVDSRNPELEETYKDLVARGTDKERERHSTAGSIVLNGNSSGSPKEKESLTSSRSSMHSGASTPATSSNIGIPSPTSQEKDAEAVANTQAALEVVRKKKAKEEAIALQKLEKAIKRDLGSRTSYSKYFLSQKNQDGLFGLCKAYALYDEPVGYPQGLNFIVMPLLFNMDDGEAFTLLVKLMNKYGLREMFTQEMRGLHLHLYQFERLLEDLEPALACHLHRRGVSPQLYATQWFLTLFAYRFPLQLVLRIYDMIFSEGLGIIIKFGLAVMQRNAQTLLAMNDMTALSHFLKEKLFNVYIDQQPSANSILESGFFGTSSSDKEIYRANDMVQDACAVKLTPEMLKTYTAEWEEKTRIEKEREAELETLRHTVATQAARIRSLEEHAEKSDTEHVQIASELVRVKVENEELGDKNEALKVRVEELEIVVDKQPAELEEKLQTEMDRIMKRNIEVHNENRAMEEQMAEMEKSLVETKMKWAEISENHETLKQKWNDLRKALD
ncbi:GTPase-activating protein [Arachnomyces sp. PD_36]|nr:GTPase-activating protein [Arachnomyces sp. PD_36]